MLKKIVLLLLFMIVPLVVAGCYNTPVRHLTSDIGMLKKGVSTEEDVLVFLGEPDKQHTLEDGRVQWLYEKTDKTVAESLPLIGKHLGTPGKVRVIITFKDKVVSDIDYNATDPDELNWKDDYSWEKQ